MFYETTFVLHQNLTSNEVETVIQGLKTFLTANETEVIRIEYWGLRNLAYKIKECKKGHYFMMHFTTKSTDLLEKFEHKVKLNDLILRHLLLRIPKIPKTESHMMEEAEE